MEYFWYLLCFFVGIALGWFINLVSSYMLEKGKNLATKEDIREITELIEGVRSQQAAGIEFLKTDLSIYQQKQISVLREKFDIYRSAIKPIIKLLTIQELNNIELLEFEQKRLEIHVQLGFVAPQSVLDAYDLIIEYLGNVFEKKDEYNWPKIRTLGFNFINEVRKDIGLNPEPVAYNGKR